MTKPVETKHSGVPPDQVEDYPDNYDPYASEMFGSDAALDGTEDGWGTGYNQGGSQVHGGGQGAGAGAGKSLATGGDPGQIPQNPNFQNAQSYAQQLKSQGYSDSQIQQKLQEMFGLSPEDAAYAMYGLPYGTSPGGAPPSKYMQYGAKYSSWGGTGTQDIQKLMQDQEQLNQAKGMQRNAKKMAAEQKVKIHMILLQIMMGDITGALRSYAVLMDRDMRQFTRLIVKKLDSVRKARSQVIRNFARTKPAKAYAGNNPAQAARAQDRSSKYTQYVQMSTQLMNELQNTERELVDALQSMHRQTQTFWESYAGFRDQEFRTNERVMTMR